MRCEFFDDGKTYPFNSEIGQLTLPTLKLQLPTSTDLVPVAVDGVPGVQLYSPTGGMTGPFPMALADDSVHYVLDLRYVGGLSPAEAGQWKLRAAFKLVGEGGGDPDHVVWGSFNLSASATLETIAAQLTALAAAITTVSGKVDTANGVLAELKRLGLCKTEYNNDFSKLYIYTLPPFEHLLGHFPLTYNDQGKLVTRGHFVAGA